MESTVPTFVLIFISYALPLIIIALVAGLCFCCGAGSILALQCFSGSPAARAVVAKLARPALRRLAGYVQ